MRTQSLQGVKLLGCLLALGCSDELGDVSAGAGSAGSGGLLATAGNGGATAGNPTSGAAGSSATAGVTSAGAAGMTGAGGGGGTSAAGNAGSGGGATAGAAGGGGSSGKAPPSKSAGCGTAAGQALGGWVERPTLPVNGKARQWWVWLPSGYDPARAYPVVFTFHGCGGPDNFIPMQKTAGADAIVVRGTGGDNGCWSYPGSGDDVKFFDAMLAETEAKFCVDSGRVFSTGYSSGAWFTNTLVCARGDKLRGAGTVSGGVVGNRGTCSGEVARLFIHDTDDTTNYFDKNGNKAELARLVAQNHCDAAVAPVPEDPAPCARYQGCDAGYSVLMCQTMGKKHDRQDTLATTAFWKLFSSL